MGFGTSAFKKYLTIQIKPIHQRGMNKRQKIAWLMVLHSSKRCSSNRNPFHCSSFTHLFHFYREAQTETEKNSV